MHKHFLIHRKTVVAHKAEHFVQYSETVAYLGFGKGGPWRARGARAYNRGLGAEPPAGSRGRAQTPLKLKHFASECSMETTNSPIFLKFGNAKDHQILLNFAILAGKWQNTHLFI